MTGTCVTRDEFCKNARPPERWTKPHASIFQVVLDRLGAQPEEAAMVGDSPEDDIAGAQALGMRAFLLDRDGRYPDWEPRLPDLYALPAALGLPRPG